MQVTHDKITNAMTRAKEGYADHRRWKRLLRLIGQEIRRVKKTEGRTAASMTTAVDNAARQCVRRHKRTVGQV